MITSTISGVRSAVNKPVLIGTRNVGVTFGLDTVLRGVSIKIRQGEFVGLVGQNGAGKTTLLRVILGLIEPTKGEVQRRKAVIGYVPQRGKLYNGIVPISVLEVASLGSKGDRAKAQSALQSVGMGSFLSRNFSDLSGGQQQRVVIAKALASGANILILDEPTTGVDKASQIEFYGLLKKLNQEDRTIIMVSHDIDSITKLVSRVICLNQAVVYDGPPEGFNAEQHLRSNYTMHVHHGEGEV